jgi:hypothetical protein
MAKIGKMGGRARANALTPEERSALARLAVRARWAKQKQKAKDALAAKKKKP